MCKCSPTHPASRHKTAALDEAIKASNSYDPAKDWCGEQRRLLDLKLDKANNSKEGE